MDKFESQIVEYVADLEYRPPAPEAIQPVKVEILT